MEQQPLFEAQDPYLGMVEDELATRGITEIVGIDEAGRGPLAGPVCAGAFWLQIGEMEKGPIGELLDDSKKMKAGDREAIFDALEARRGRWAMAMVSAEVIDEINILQATFRAMRQALSTVVESVGRSPQLVVIDGHMVVPEVSLAQQAVVKGDGRSRAIAAASVVAKVTRDRWMKKAGETWPAYGFGSHKGYGTRQHREALEQHGPCPIHRRSFGGVPSI